MTGKCIVTITRQFGSLGRPIARQVAERMGVEFYDRDIVEKTAQSMDLPISYISKNEENQGGIYSRMRFPLGTSSRRRQDEIYAVQSEIILGLAVKGPCVIVGRCSDYILRDFKNTLHVFIYAPLDARVRNCVEVLGMDEATALKMIVQVDRARQQYHARYAGTEMDEKRYRHLMIDSSYLGAEGTAELICHTAQSRFASS